MVQLACDLCPRREQYRKEALIARFGGDVRMPYYGTSLRECPREDSPGVACAAAIFGSGLIDASCYRSRMLANERLAPRHGARSPGWNLSAEIGKHRDAKTVGKNAQAEKIESSKSDQA
jgi:hypothetical protein